MNMNSGANKTPIEVITEEAFGKGILETFILVLTKSGTVSKTMKS